MVLFDTIGAGLRRLRPDAFFAPSTCHAGAAPLLFLFELAAESEEECLSNHAIARSAWVQTVWTK